MAITRPDTALKTSQFRPGIIETVFPARITVGMLKTTFAEVERLGYGPLWLADTTATTSFETGCIPLAGTVLLGFKKKGMKRVVAIVASPAVRMAARAVALASSLEIRVVERRLEAMPFLTLVS